MKFDELNVPVTRDDVKKFKKEYLIGALSFRGDVSMLPAIIIVFGVVVGLMFAMARAGGFGSVVMGVILLAFCALVYLIYCQLSFKEVAESIRAQRIAESNGWTYRYRATTVSYIASLFTTGRNSKYRDVIDTPTFQVGHYGFTTGYGRDRQDYDYGYMVMPLDRRLPHMVLDSKSNDTNIFGMNFSNLPVTFDRSQTISLEGDFDRFYTLYAPGGYDVDVRYLFTPDVMQLLMRESDDVDMEILDDHIYVYFSDYDMGSLAFWQRVERLHSLLGNKLVRQSDHYTDDKTVDGSVAPQGQRLKTSVPIVSIVIIALYVIYSVIRALVTAQQ